MRLEVSGLDFAYGATGVLEDVSFDVEGGSLTGILGPNGSGKTTLLKCINGILKPRGGTITLNGEDSAKFRGTARAKAMGYVPQMEGRSFPSKVFDAILLGRRPYIQWSPSERDLKKVSDVIGLLSLEDIAMRDINKLSGGQRQKVIIGRALVQEPGILLLDEPTANLDLRHQKEVMDIVRDQASRGMLVLLSIHDLNLAARYCDRIVMLRNGGIFAVGGKEVLTPSNIRSVFGIDVEVIDHGGVSLVVPV